MEVPALAAVSRRNVPPESSVRSFMLESPNPLPKLDGVQGNRSLCRCHYL